MSKPFATLGWQWGCLTRIADEDCDDPDRRFFDSWQNPEDGPSMARAAQAHADRTGHETYLERHQRRVIKPRANLEN